jgi:hypothetical protein
VSGDRDPAQLCQRLVERLPAALAARAARYGRFARLRGRDGD